MHASNDLAVIYRDLEQKVDSISKDLLSLTEAIEGAEFYGARIKERARVAEKLEYRTGDEIGDILGARIVADSDEALDAVIDGLRQRGATLLDIDDFRDQPRGSGYRAVHVQIAAGEASFELQVQPRPIREVQDEAHEIYSKWRHRTPAAGELAEAAADQARANKLFSDAWEKWRANPRNRDKAAPGSAQGEPAAKSSQGLLDPESAKIAEALQRDAAAVEQELREALDEGLISQEDFDAAVAAGDDPADIARAFEEAAFCLSRSL